jgi:hypothetical protein
MKSQSSKRRVHAHTRQRTQGRGPRTGGRSAPVHSSETTPAPETESNEGQLRLQQLKDLETALQSLKDSSEKLVGLAKAQSDCIIGQWARVEQLREIQEKALRDQSFAERCGRMWT